MITATTKQIREQFNHRNGKIMKTTRPPNFTNQQIEQIFNNSTKYALQITKKQLQLYEKNSSDLEVQLKKNLVNLPFTNVQSIWNSQNFGVTQYVQGSAMKQIVKFYLNQMTNLIQIQDLIDPITMKPIQLPSGKDVATFVLQTLQLAIQNAISNILWAYKQSPTLFQIKMRNLLQPLLNKVESQCNSFNFNVQQKSFMQMLQNVNCLKNIQTKKINQIQTKALQNAKKLSVGSPFTDIKQFAKIKILQALNLKHQYKIQNKTFFSKVQKPPTENLMVQQIIKKQIDFMKS